MNALGGTSITIGDKALFSNNIEIHTTDYHKIYDEHGNIGVCQELCVKKFSRLHHSAS